MSPRKKTQDSLDMSKDETKVLSPEESDKLAAKTFGIPLADVKAARETIEGATP